MALINAQTQQKPKLNVTNIKSPIGKIGAAPISKIKPVAKFQSPKIKPLDLNIDTQQIETNIGIHDNVISLEKRVKDVEETNKTLVEIQGILSNEFTSRILRNKEELSRIRRSGDQDKRDSAESGVEAVKKFGKGVGKQFDAVLAPAKSIWTKVLNVLGILGTGFLLDKGLDFFKDQKNLDKITGFFNFLDKHGTTILAILGGVLVFKIIRKIQKLYKSLRAAWKVARNITRRIQGKPPLPKPKPKVKITKGTGGNRFRNPLRSRTKITGTGSGIKNPFKPKPKITGNITKTPGPLKKAFKFVDDGAKGLGKKMLGGFGKKAMSKGVLKFLRPILKRIPIVGVLLDFGLSVALGEDPGRAAFGAIGAGLLAAIGTMLGGPVGTLLGGLAGDWAGRKLYDLFFGGKNEGAGDDSKNQKMNKGGTVMGKNVGNQDSQLIHATVGEKVVNRKDSKRFGPFIDDINSNGGTLISGMMASIQAQESNMESFAAANAKLTLLLGSFTDTTNTQKKNIRTTIPISTPQIVNKELKKSTSGNSSSQVITLPSIQKGGNQSAPAPVAGGTDITPIAAEDPSNSYLAYTMSGLGIYGS